MSNKVLFTSSTVSDGNMSFRRGDPDEALKNRLNFFKKNKLDYAHYVGMAPTHTNGMRIVTLFDKGKMLNETDGIITDDTSIPLFTLTGDCIPLALIDPDKKVFALVHMSWKNAGSGMLTEAISTFIYQYHSAPEKITAKIGPSIGPCCYFQKDPLQKKNKKWQAFIRADDGAYSIDLWGFVENELKLLGLKKTNIDNPKICSFHSGKYFSHHRVVKEKLENDFRFGTILTIQ